MRFNFDAVKKSLVISSVIMSVAVGCRWDTSPASDEEFASTSSASSAPSSIAGGARQASQSIRTPESTSAAVVEPEGELTHSPGAHGGTIVPIGAESYHAEVVFEKSGKMRLLMLGKDETQTQDVEQQALQAYIQTNSESAAETIALFAAPQEGDSTGMTSQFTGQLPESLLGKELKVTIPNLRIRGNRFRVGFTTATESPVGRAGNMPPPVGSEREQQLYFSAAGKYTAADIEANGLLPPSQKFKAVRAARNRPPAIGDPLCPVTRLKANPKLTWIVDAQPYNFCSPNCIDEFVQLAKEHPDQIKMPELSVK